MMNPEPKPAWHTNTIRLITFRFKHLLVGCAAKHDEWVVIRTNNREFSVFAHNSINAVRKFRGNVQDAAQRTARFVTTHEPVIVEQTPHSVIVEAIEQGEAA